MYGRTNRPGERFRIPLEQAIGLRFKHHGEFIDEQTVNLSNGGIFIRTQRPHPVGSVFEFELRPGRDLPLLAGKAQVAWVRRRSDYLDEPVGMGVRFVELDDESRRQLAELVASYEAGAGETTDRAEPTPDEPASADAQAPPDPAAAPPPGVDPVVESEPTTTTANAPPSRSAGAAFADEPARRSRLPWILLPIVLSLALAAGLWLRPRAATPPAAAAPTDAAPHPAAATTHGVGGTEETAETGALRAIDEWARAWSEQRVDDYLAAYSSRYEPPGGLDPQEWERQRRTRVRAPDWIDVTLAFVELEASGGDRSRVRFVQIYASDSYRDVVRKVVDLERDNGAWKILRETVEP